MNDILEFSKQREACLAAMKENVELSNLSTKFIKETGFLKYTYNFDWLGLPIIQFPQDIIAVQEIIWKTKPDIIIETGIARGGSLILSASILHLLNGNGKVIGIDIDIRPHNRQAIELHPLAHRIVLIQGSSTDNSVLEQLKQHVKSRDRVMVILDSNHVHEHILQELQLYSPIVTKDCYLVVMDTVIEDMPEDYFPNRPWGKGNNPKTAVHAFLKTTDRFQIDESIQNKLLITVAPDGYLKCVK